VTHTQTLTLPEPYPCVFVNCSPAWLNCSPAPSSPPSSTDSSGSGSANPLPPGVVLWGPSHMGGFDFRSSDSKWWWNHHAVEWQSNEGREEYGNGTRDEITSNPPTCPPPDHPAPRYEVTPTDERNET